jgi:death-on-curing protein
LIDFLSVSDVLLLHANQIDLYGGELGVRDWGLLASAVAQPQATMGGELLHKFPFGTAAAYLFHLVQNHSFVDGNKRTGAVSALVFLDLNDIEFEASLGSLYELTMAVATGQADKVRIAEYFQQHGT